MHCMKYCYKAALKTKTPFHIIWEVLQVCFLHTHGNSVIMTALKTNMPSEACSTMMTAIQHHSGVAHRLCADIQCWPHHYRPRKIYVGVLTFWSFTWRNGPTDRLFSTGNSLHIGWHSAVLIWPLGHKDCSLKKKALLGHPQVSSDSQSLQWHPAYNQRYGLARQWL